VDLVKTAWLPTDVGMATPADALRRATQTTWKRGDWDGATLLLLHALLQTAVCLKPDRCPGEREWRGYVHAPPEDLSDWLDQPIGERPWESLTANGEMHVGRLLFGSPGENAVDVKASDIAVWAQNVPTQLTRGQATIAVVADNLMGTRIGRGHLAGVRGEQPLTTLVEPVQEGASLWERVWLNVLPADAWAKRMHGADVAFCLPWTLEPSEQSITPQNAHSLTVLWQMPRRWRLTIDRDGMVRTIHRQAEGHNYDGWEHPLTPYRQLPTGRFPAKTSPHLGYRDWAGIALNARTDLKPAVVVNEYIENQWAGEPLRIRCFGWLLDSAGAPGAWIETLVPFYARADAGAVENALDKVADAEKRVRRALEQVRGGWGRYAERTYALTEPAFFERVATNAWGDWPELVARAIRDVFWSVMEMHRVDVMVATRATGRL